MVNFATENGARLVVATTADTSAGSGTVATGPCVRATDLSTDLSADLVCAAELERLGDSIAELAAHVHAATYRLLVMLAEFDRRGGWGGGFRSCAHWLSWRTRIDLGAAREKVRVARALQQLPLLSDALRRGELSYAVVRAATRVATPQNEQELLELARHSTASHVERVVRAWRRVDRLQEQWAERERHRSRALQLYPDDDGMYVLRGRLSPEVGALLERALAAASEALYAQGNGSPPAGAESTTYPQRQADAIGLLAEWALGGGSDSHEPPSVEPPVSANHAVQSGTEPIQPANAAVEQPADRTTTAELSGNAVSGPDQPARRQRPQSVSRAERFQVVVHVDAEALRADTESGQSLLAGGTRISAETCRRIACDANRVIMVHDRNGTVLDVGRRTRTVPSAIRRALEHRDRGCRFPGCGLRMCDAHHIAHWIDGGRTELSNLVLLCRRHHRLVHEEGFGMQLSATGEVTFTRPDGRPLPHAPAAPRLPEHCTEQLIAAHCEMGLEIHPWTPTPDWHGERLDLDFTIRALRAH